MMTLLPTRRPRVRRPRAPRATVLLAVALTTAGVLSACDARGSLTAPSTAFSGTSRPDSTSEQARDPALIGIWQRRLHFIDSNGDAWLSETTWTFRRDGSATRILAAANFDTGVGSRLVSDAHWSASRASLEIDWRPPRYGKSFLYYHVFGRTAQIGGDVYHRID